MGYSLLRILLVEDNPGDARLLKEELRQVGAEVNLGAPGRRDVRPAAAGPGSARQPGAGHAGPRAGRARPSGRGHSDRHG